MKIKKAKITLRLRKLIIKNAEIIAKSFLIT